MRALVLALGLLLAALAPASAGDKSAELDGLFARLRNAPAVEVKVIENEIWGRWMESGDDLIDSALGQGTLAMSAGHYAIAMALFEEVITRKPDFAEGWNKRATLFWLIGELDASIADIARTLALEPRHFGALSGLGMIEEARGRLDRAIAAYDQALAANPRLDGVRAQRDLLKRKLNGERI
ncbi:MAG: tetratricopeptide repeat protein [Alphaproteobacteria bacterium]|nr:tetratricopeptide repeat protein [Alphaproteobacteria bacterium]